MESRPAAVSFAEAFRFWLKLGFISFGGPTGQIAIMHQELVERRRWISESRFLHALNYCMVLPGPEAQQLATYIGWLMHRTWGGIVSGGLFVLPDLSIIEERTLPPDVAARTIDLVLSHGLDVWVYAGTDWPWIIVGSYNAHAILDPRRMIVTHPGGFVEVRDADYRPVADAALDAGVVAQALGAMRRFYR